MTRNRYPVDHNIIVNIKAMAEMRYQRNSLKWAGFWGRSEVKAKFYKAYWESRQARLAAQAYGSRLP